MTQTYPIPAALLVRLRQLQAQSQALTEGCAAGLGLDLSTHAIDFNLDSGIVTATARAPLAFPSGFSLVESGAADIAASTATDFPMKDAS